MLDSERLVFINETYGSTAMVWLRGPSPRGERLVGYTPHGHWKRITILAGLRRHRVMAPCVLDGAMNGRMFHAYVDQYLVRTLKQGYMVVMDNLPVHKLAGAQEAIEAARAELRYLPPHSPDVKPTETAFSNLKALLRNAAERTVPDLTRRIWYIAMAFSTKECNNFLHHTGDAQTRPSSTLEHIKRCVEMKLVRCLMPSFLPSLSEPGSVCAAFAAPIRMSPNAITNCVGRGQLPHHITPIAVLVGEMAAWVLRYRPAIAKVPPMQAPRGATRRGRCRGDRQVDLDLKS